MLKKKGLFHVLVLLHAFGVLPPGRSSPFPADHASAARPTFFGHGPAVQAAPASLAAYPGIIAAEGRIAEGYTNKQPDLIISVWAPQYTEKWGTVLSRTEAAAALTKRFPGNHKFTFISPTIYYHPLSVTHNAANTEVTITGDFYFVDPNDPSNDEHGNSDGGGRFQQIWQRPRKGKDWLLVIERRADDRAAGDRAQDLAQAASKEKQLAGLLP